jgi:hypothetical protein
LPIALPTDPPAGLEGLDQQLADCLDGGGFVGELPDGLDVAVDTVVQERSVHFMFLAVGGQ